MPEYLGLKGFAARIGVQPITLKQYDLPSPDILIDDVKGWLPATVDAWQASRPGRGGRKPHALEQFRPRMVQARKPHGRTYETPFAALALPDFTDDILKVELNKEWYDFAAYLRLIHNT